MNQVRSVRHGIGVGIMAMALVFLSISLGRYWSRMPADFLGIALYVVSIALLALTIVFLLLTWLGSIR